MEVLGFIIKTNLASGSVPRYTEIGIYQLRQVVFSLPLYPTFSLVQLVFSLALRPYFYFSGIFPAPTSSPLLLVPNQVLVVPFTLFSLLFPKLPSSNVSLLHFAPSPVKGAASHLPCLLFKQKYQEKRTNSVFVALNTDYLVWGWKWKLACCLHNKEERMGNVPVQPGVLLSSSSTLPRYSKSY